VEPFGAGGGVDAVARAVAKKLSEIWQLPVTVDNHPGGGSTAAPALVARSAPDGYTLLVNSNAQIYSAIFRSDLPYDPSKDFVTVAPLTRQAYVLVSGAASRITSVAVLLKAAKEHPGTLKFGSPGVGTGSHVGSEKFNLAADIDAVHVPAGPTEGIVETLASLAEGRTDYVVAPISLALTGIKDGKLRALAVSTRARSPLLPGTPTIAESGIANFDYPIWYGVWAPAGTSAAVVQTLSADIARALASPDMREWLAARGAEAMKMSQREFARFVEQERRDAARLMKAIGNGGR
jgi:tripartite-type tricarboxylate transporter receptor subunit TctC